MLGDILTIRHYRVLGKSSEKEQRPSCQPSACTESDRKDLSDPAARAIEYSGATNAHDCMLVDESDLDKEVLEWV